jgi:Baseplate J-like protein
MPAIPKLVLDSNNDNDRLEQARIRAVNASGGLLSGTDDPTLEGILEGIIYADAELAYYFNLIPEATALEVLRLYGVTRSAGTRAKGTVEVSLTAASTGFTLPAGYLIPYQPDGYESSTNNGYTLDTVLLIPPGQVSGRVDVTATAVGSAFNIGVYQLQTSGIGQALIANVTNVTPINGGSDLETLEALKTRGNREMRRRDSLISIADYEQAASDLYGYSCRAVAIPFLDNLKTDKEAIGQVHVFLMGADGTVPSSAQLVTIQDKLQSQVCAGSIVWVSAMSNKPVNIRCTLATPDITAPTAQAVRAAIVSHLSPLTYPSGVTLDYIGLAARILSVPGVTRVTSLFLDGEANDVPIPNRWTIPTLDGLEVALVNPAGQTAVYQLGTGIGDPD